MWGHHMHPHGLGYNPLMTAMMNPAMFGFMNPYFTGMYNPMGLGYMNPYFMTHMNPYFMASMNPYLNMWHNPMTYGGMHAAYGAGPMNGISGRSVAKRYLKNRRENGEGKDSGVQAVSEGENSDAGLRLTSGEKVVKKSPERILLGFKKRIGAKAFAEEMAKVDRDFGISNPYN